MTPRCDAWDEAPCGLLTLDEDGTIAEANETFLRWVGRDRAAVVGQVRLSQLLSVGGRIYWETHLSPLLHVEGRVDEVALELRAPDGRLAVLMTAVATPGDEARVVRVALSGASERARYERELLAARRAADRSAGRIRALQDVTAGLSGAAGVTGVMDAVLAAAVGPLGGSAATMWLADARAGLRAHVSTGEDGGTAPRPTSGLGLGVAQVEDDRVVVALHGRATLQGVLSIRPREDPGADPVDLDVLTAVGQQAGLALDRAILYEQSAEVAHQLQQSLLAGATPQDGRFEITTTYRAGVENLEVGGDWYDAFLVAPDVLAITVGDVVGRGLRAASAMGQLRSAVRAIAGPGVGPADVLSRLDSFVEHVEGAAWSTLAYAAVELGTGRVHYACAAHMPPLLIPAEGAPRLAWEGRSTPLGMVLPGRPRTAAELQLRPGDRLVLYTDGLVERRDRALSIGLDALVQAAAGAGAAPAARTVGDLTARLLAGQQRHDDVCVLLLSWLGGDPQG